MGKLDAIAPFCTLVREQLFKKSICCGDLVVDGRLRQESLIMYKGSGKEEYQ